MATRENQTLQIALMVFCVITVLLAILAYFFYDNMKKYSTEAEDLKERNTQAEQAGRDALQESQTLKRYLGFPEQESMEEIDTAFTEIIQRVSRGDFAEEQRNFRAVLESIAQDNKTIIEREAAAKEQIRRLQGALDQLEAEKNKQIAQHQKSAQQAAQEAAQDRAQFERDRNEFKTKTQNLENQIADIRKQYEDTIATSGQQIEQLTADVTALQQQLEICQSKLPEEPGRFEIADGRVARVNLYSNTVWIDVGRADGLRTQTAFSVFDSDAPVAATAEPKGMIEVIEVVGDHVAKARITDYDSTNPILTRDKIYSPVWHRGAKIRFALAGLIDLDGDGEHDIERAISLIQLNGGGVDAFVDSEGMLQDEDKMGVATRYLIVGASSDTGGEKAAALDQASTKLITAAERYGVEQIGLDKFLDLMGWKRTARTVPLGTSARGEDYIRKQPRGPTRYTPGPFNKRVARTPY